VDQDGGRLVHEVAQAPDNEQRSSQGTLNRERLADVHHERMRSRPTAGARKALAAAWRRTVSMVPLWRGSGETT